MAKYKRYDYSQKLFIPVSLEDQLMPGTLEFAIHTLVETRMDMSVFDGNYKNDKTGRSAYDPKVLLKVVLLGYSRGLMSSRKKLKVATFLMFCTGISIGVLRNFPIFSLLWFLCLVRWRCNITWLRSISYPT